MTSMFKPLKSIIHSKTHRISLIFLFISFITDQISKFWILNYLGENNVKSLGPFIDLYLVWNNGISYGWFSAYNGRIIIIVISVFICIYLTYMLIQTTSKLYVYSLGLLLGGALGNIVDRVIHGKVIDFIALHYQKHYWYIFNIADMWITIGIIIILINTFIIKGDIQ